MLIYAREVIGYGIKYIFLHSHNELDRSTVDIIAG